MSDLTTFDDLPYARPDLTKLESDYTTIITGMQAAATSADALALVHQWNTLRSDIGTMHSLAEVHYTQNVADEDAKEEKNFYDAHMPTVIEWNTTVAKKVLESPHRAAIAAACGSLFLDRLEQADKTFAPEMKEMLIRESELMNRYNEITASARIEVNGETYNLSSLGTLHISLDRTVRERAVVAQYNFLKQHGTELDDIFDKLVHLRDEKAHLLGFPSYTEFRYVEFGRIDYTSDDVARFREQVREHVVPLATMFREAQARRLGLDSVHLYDEKLHFVDGNPVAEGDHDWIVERAQRMYADLSPETHEFFDLMQRRELMDLKSRDNKATGGYCTSFPTYGVPFIFANFNKTTHDVEVLTHEAGHAFQAYRSRSFSIPEYRWPTAEACEIHSMGMEFLTWPWMDLFFGSQTDKFRFYHLQGALVFLPYGCAVDEFQHWVYANVDATPQERNDKWSELESIYMPWRDLSDVPYANAGTQWQFQRHIYESPFYYIDYALAQTCALQFWKRSQEDRRLALEDYLRICDVGGSQAFLEIVKTGNLQSPFEPGTLSEIVEYAHSWLKRHYAHYL